MPYPACCQIWLLLVHGGRGLHPHSELASLIAYDVNAIYRNRKYLDKNFGGIFSLWDRAFGTFEEERETPVYGMLCGAGASGAIDRDWWCPKAPTALTFFSGIVHPLTNNEPIWSQLHHLLYIVELIQRTPGMYNKVCGVA